MGHSPPPHLCLKHLPGMTLHLPLSPSLWGHLDQQLPRGQQRRVQNQAAGQEGWQDRSHGKGETGMKETACTLWEKAWGGVGKGSNPLTSSPFKGLELLFTFCQRWKGKEEEEHLPHHPHRHTDTRSPIPHPQRLHRPLDNTTFKDKQPLPSPTTTLPASSQRQRHPGTGGAPAPHH